MAVRCLGSLRRFSTPPVRLRLHDDGTLTGADLARLSQALGGPEVVARGLADEKIEPRLSSRPRLLALRRRNPLAMKLLDVALLEGEWLRYCDSDVLFLRPFEDLFQDNEPTADAVFMADPQNAYSIRSWELLGRSRRVRLVRNLNSGIIRFPVAALDLDYLEWLAGHLSFAPEWMEQTCWAALASRVSSRLLDSRQVTIPEIGKELPAECVAAHFVASVRSALSSRVDHVEKTAAPAVKVASTPARRCRPFDLATSEARRALARFRAAARQRALVGETVRRSHLASVVGGFASSAR